MPYFIWILLILFSLDVQVHVVCTTDSFIEEDVSVSMRTSHLFIEANGQMTTSSWDTEDKKKYTNSKSIAKFISIKSEQLFIDLWYRVFECYVLVWGLRLWRAELCPYHRHITKLYAYGCIDPIHNEAILYWSNFLSIRSNTDASIMNQVFFSIL